MENVVKMPLTVVDVKTFTRRSQKIGQELLVLSGTQYPAVVECPDQDVLDLTNLKGGDNITADVTLTFTSVQCVSDSGKKFYKRIPTWKIKNIL